MCGLDMIYGKQDGEGGKGGSRGKRRQILKVVSPDPNLEKIKVCHSL